MCVMLYRVKYDNSIFKKYVQKISAKRSICIRFEWVKLSDFYRSWTRISEPFIKCLVLMDVSYSIKLKKFVSQLLSYKRGGWGVGVDLSKFTLYSYFEWKPRRKFLPPPRGPIKTISYNVYYYFLLL